jgi:hypothetical protein
MDVVLAAAGLRYVTVEIGGRIYSAALQIT